MPSPHERALVSLRRRAARIWRKSDDENMPEFYELIRLQASRVRTRTVPKTCCVTCTRISNRNREGDGRGPVTRAVLTSFGQDRAALLSLWLPSCIHEGVEVETICWAGHSHSWS